MTFTPTDRGTYQQGLIGKFPVPDFSDSDLAAYLHNSELHYKFEVNSPYPSEAVFANFERLASPIANQTDERDQMTGKVFAERFHIPYGGGDIHFNLETYPYHNGSKAVIYAAVPATETAPGEVDFAVLLADVKRRLEMIAKD